MVEAILNRWLPVWMGFLVLGVPFAYYLSEPFTTAAIQVISLLFAALIASSRLAHQGNRISTWFYRGTLVWLSFVGLSAVLSVDPTISIPVFCKVLGLVLVTVGVRYALTDERSRSILLICIGISVLIQGWIGIAEYMRGTPMPATWVDPGMRDIIKSRSSSLFTDPNIYGAFLAGLLPFVVAGLFQAGENYLLISFWTFCLMTGGMALFMSFSRGAYLAALVAGGILLLVMRPSLRLTPRKQFFIFALILLAIVFFTGPYKVRLFSVLQPSDMTVSQRTLINQALAGNWSKVPLFGFGLHTFSQVYPRFRVVGGDYPMNAHNEFFQTWFECGPLAALTLFGLTLLLLVQVFNLIRTSPPPHWMAGASAASFCGLLVHNVSGFSSRILPTAVLIAVSVGGLLFSSRREDLAPALLIPRDRSRRLMPLLMMIFVLLSFKHLHVQLLLAEAGRALGTREIIQAESALIGVERVDGNNPTAQYLLAQVDQAYGRFSNADQRLTLAIDYNPGEALFWVARARLARLGKRGDFRSYMDKAVSLDPAAEMIRLEYARMLADEGQTASAIAQLDETLKRSPGFHDVYRTYLEVEQFRRELRGEAVPASKTATIEIGRPEENFIIASFPNSLLASDDFRFGLPDFPAPAPTPTASEARPGLVPLPISTPKNPGSPSPHELNLPDERTPPPPLKAPDELSPGEKRTPRPPLPARLPELEGPVHTPSDATPGSLKGPQPLKGR